MEKNGDTIEMIIKDLEDISPLALPEYIEKIQFYEMEDSMKILDKAVKEFEGKGGITGNLVDTIFTSVGNSTVLVLAKKFDEPTYKKIVKGKINTAGSLKQIFNFKYPDNVLKNQVKIDSTPYYTNDQLRRDASGIDKKYNQKNYRDNTRNEKFKENMFKNSDTRKDITGRTVTNDRNTHRSLKGEADHVKPLQKIHLEGETFIRRYSSEESIKKIVNSDENFQLLAGGVNASKGGARTNKEFIKYTEDIDKAAIIYSKPEDKRTNEEKEFLRANITDTQKKAAKLKAKEISGQHLTEEEKQKLEKYKLTEEAKENLKNKQELSEKKLKEKLMKDGSKTVMIEQIGKLAEILVGPIAFEIKDSIKNGVMYGIKCNDKIEAFGKRISRAFGYIVKQLLKWLGDLLGDFVQMLATFVATMIKSIKDFFGKMLEVIVSGFSVIIDSVKILLNNKTSGAEKGDAIVKLIVGFITNVLGTVVIDKLLNSFGIPDPFSDILAALASALISSVVLYGMDKLDLFSIKDEQRYNFIVSVFEAKKRKIKQDTAKFDIAITEHLKKKTIEEVKRIKGINEAIENGNFEILDREIDSIVAEFKIDIPYKNTDEFLKFVKDNEKIYIKT